MKLSIRVNLRLSLFLVIGLPRFARDVKTLSRFSFFHLFFQLLYFLFHVLDFDTVLADIEAQAGVNAHVLVGNPDQGKAADQVAAPVVKQEFVVRDEQEKNGHIMAEAKFAGKKKVEFTAKINVVVFTLTGAVFTRLTENFFMRYRPGNAGNGDGQYKQPYDLQSERHSYNRGDFYGLSCPCTVKTQGIYNLSHGPAALLHY